MAGLMDLLNSLRGGMPGQEMPAAPPMAMPGMDPKTQMTGFAPPVQVAPSKGLRGMFGLDDQVGQSGFSRGDMGALALSQFGSTYGRNANGGNGGNQLIQSMVASKAKENQAQSKRQQLAAQMKAAGYSEQDIVAVQFAPEQAIKAIYDRAAPYTLNQGDARFGPGGKLEANNPKFAYQNDTILQEGPGGVQNMGRLDPSFENIETNRNNTQQNQIGWANVGIGRQNANTNAYSAETGRMKTNRMGGEGNFSLSALKGADRSMMETVQESQGRTSALRGLAQQFMAHNARQPSGPLGGIQFWDKDVGAMDSLASQMIGFMRVPGSGATSDFEQKLYISGVPGLGKMGTTNQVIAKNIETLANMQDARRNFYEDYAMQTGTLGGAEQAFQSSAEFQNLVRQHGDVGGGGSGSDAGILLDERGLPIK